MGVTVHQVLLLWLRGCVTRPLACAELQTGYLMLSMGDVAGAEAMFDRAAGRPQVM